MRFLAHILFILIITSALLSTYSFSDFDISLGGLKFKKAKIKEFFLDIPDNPISRKMVKGEYSNSLRKPEQQPMDSSSQRILLIGDSMLEGLMLRLKDYTSLNNHDLKTVIWYSSSTEYFGRSDTLKYFINQYKPSYIMLVLGANELFVSDIIRKRKPYVKHILKQIDTTNFVWIGPPNWKEDTGINDLILNSVGSGHYFSSKNLNYARSKDGAHPTHASSSVWMDSIAVWIMRDSYKPILLRKPVEKSKKSGNVTILQPLT